MKIVPHQAEKTKILVVEDDDDLRALLEALLERQGYEVETADGGLNALASLSTFKPHLILLDLTMPDMDGYTFLERKNGNVKIHKIPVIILTARDGDKALIKNVIRALDLGAQNYVTKPFDNANLLARIRRLLDRSYPCLALKTQVIW